MLLNTFRSGALSIFTKMLFSVMLFSAVVGLAMMDYNGMFRAGIHSDTVATVAGEPISAQVFDSAVRRALSGKSLDPKTAYRMGYVAQILQSEINEKLVSRAAYDLGIVVGDDTVAREVSQLLAPYVSKDVTPREALKRLLMNQGMSEGEFAQTMRVEMADGILQNALQSGAKLMPEDEVRDLYRYQHEERTLKLVALPNDAVKDYKEPVDAVLMPFYESGKERFAIPEARTFSMLVLTADSVKKGITISDDDLKKAWQDGQSSYTLPERRVMQQAVFKDEATAKAAAGKVKNGTALKEAAGTPDAWLGEQTFEKKGLDATIADPAFAAAKGAVVGPVQTPIGWHVLVVKDILPGRPQTFAEVKEQIRKELQDSRTSEELYKLSGKLDDQLAGGTTPEDAAKDMDLPVKKFGPVRADGSTPDSHEGFKDYPQDRPNIMKTVFGLSEGETSPVQELKDGSFIAVRIDHVTPKSYKPFAEVRAELGKLWIADQQDVMNKDRAQAALQDLDSGRKTLEQVAQDNHVQVQTLSLKRSDEAVAPLTPTAKEKFFSIGKGVNAAGSAKGGYIVGQVAAIRLPDADKITAGDLKDLTRAATQAAQDEYLEAYVGYLRGKYGFTVYDNVLKQMYGGSDTPDNADGQN